MTQISQIRVTSDSDQGHRQSDEHWNRFKGKVVLWETFEGDGVERIIMGFSERTDTISELN